MAKRVATAIALMLGALAQLPPAIQGDRLRFGTGLQR